MWVYLISSAAPPSVYSGGRGVVTHCVTLTSWGLEDYSGGLAGGANHTVAAVGRFPAAVTASRGAVMAFVAPTMLTDNGQLHT